MKITTKCKEELLKKGFKEIKINGLQNLVNSGKGCGFEIKSNHLNSYIMVAGEKIFNPTILPELLEDAMTIFENTNEMIHHHEGEATVTEKINPAKTYLETGELVKYTDNCTKNPGSAILPLYLTKAMFDKHPGTIAAILSLQDTPELYVEQLGNKAYVEGHYVTRALNWIFKYKWSSVHEETREDDLEFSVKMQFIATMDDGSLISKGITGTADKKFSKTIKDEDGARQIIQIGDTIKAAITDAKKKFYSELGGSQDVYSGLNKGGGV